MRQVKVLLTSGGRGFESEFYSMGMFGKNLFCWNWKYCSKIIFKCVNSMVKLIFNEKVTENGCLWVCEWCMDVLFIVEKSTKPALEKRGKSWVQTKPTYRENLGNIFESLGSSWIIFNTLSMSFDFKVRE